MMSPPPPGTGPVLVFLPAMGVPASYYEPWRDRLRERGFEVLLHDLPGQGADPRRARRGDDFGYRDVVEALLPEAVAQARRRFPGRPVLVGGHSLGGQLAVAAASRLGPIDGLVLVAAGTAHWRAWPADRRLRAALVVHAIGWAARLLPWYPGHRLGFGGPQSRRLMRDWYFNARTGRYSLDGSESGARALEASLREVSWPVLHVHVGGDPIAPKGAADELLAHLPAAPVVRVRVHGEEGKAPWQQHFSWARRATGVDAAVADWALGLGPAGRRPAPARTGAEALPA